MSLLAPLGLVAALLALPVLAIHMLRPRRPRARVSSLLLWDALKRPVSASQPWQRLRWSLLLVLQLLAVALFALGLARPARVESAPLAAHTVFIVDASGSMAAIDGAPDRLGEAVDVALQLRDRLPDGGTASVVAASARPAVLLESSEDRNAFARGVRSIRTIAGPADFETAFALAESLVAADRPTGFVLVSDGGVAEGEQRLAPAGTRFEAVGEDDTNRAITDLVVSAAPAGLRALVTVAGTGGADATQTLRVDVDGVTADRREIRIPAGGVVEEIFELPTGARVAVFLEGEDLLAADNQRYAAAPAAGGLKVRVHAEESFFIDRLLAAIPDIDVTVAPDENVDVEIYAGVAVPVAPTVPS